MIKTIHDTVKALNELLEEMPTTSKPIAIWVGAGASSWCGLKRWDELAECLHKAFKRFESVYDAEAGKELLLNQNYPAAFQLFKSANSQRYANMLIAELSIIPPSPLFLRFCTALSRIQPVSILTTNVDEMLEKYLQNTSTISRNNLAKTREMLISGKPFVCKLHGSISDIDSIIFTTEDYTNLGKDEPYLSQLSAILSECHIIFVGYGLRDKYLIDLLEKNLIVGKIFGDGPHYAVLSETNLTLPKTIKVIEYDSNPHADHRDPIIVLEELGHKKSKDNPQTAISNEPLRSAHLLFHVLAPGTHTSSNRITITNQDTGDQRELLVGPGFTNEEFPVIRSTAMHDILVGLLCFDEIYAHSNGIGSLHNILGSEIFWHLVSDGSLKFIKWENIEGVIFPDSASIAGGDLGETQLFNSDKSVKSAEQLILSQLSANPGHETKAKDLFQLLQDKMVCIPAEVDAVIPDYTRSLLLRPSIRQLLGISGGNPVNSLTRWNVFPVLRLANVVKIGIACSKLGIASAKLDFGAASLAGPAFSILAGNEWADAYASYVVCGRFSADLGAIALQDATVIDSILKFRLSSNGSELRRTILSRLVSNKGADASIAINGALREAIPSRILQEARDSFIGFYASSETSHGQYTAFWNDQRCSEAAIVLWRKNSQHILDRIVKLQGIKPYDYCPCGSGDKFRFCCHEALWRE